MITVNKMDYRTSNSLTQPEQPLPVRSSSRHDNLVRELQQRAEQLRDEGTHAADFWLAEQYEMSAQLLQQK